MTAADAPRCGFTVATADGDEQPCDHLAFGWRWYQDVRDHGDCLEPACSVHMNEGGQRLHAAESEVQQLRASDATLEVIHLRREVEGQLRLQREMGTLQDKVYAELERLRVERDALSSLLRGMARRVGRERRWGRTATSRAAAMRLQARNTLKQLGGAVGVRHVGFNGDDHFQADAQKAIGAVLRQRADLADARAQVAAVRALADDLEREVVALRNGRTRHRKWSTARALADAASRIRAVLDGSAGSPEKLSVQPKDFQTPAGSPETGDTAAPLPRRDDHVAAWIKAARDQQNPDGTPWDLGRWNVLDDLLEDYRLHADTGTPIDQHACDSGYCCADEPQPVNKDQRTDTPDKDPT